jgi:hypothetical protein
MCKTISAKHGLLKLFGAFKSKKFLPLLSETSVVFGWQLMQKG